MRRAHFAAFAPLCPTCLRHARGRHRLVIARALAEQDGDVSAGLLHCSNPACQHEYPIIDGIPIIVPSLGPLLVERGIELMLRTDLDPALESLFGDALGPGSWLDVIRQTVSTYAWDGWADLDPDETPPRHAARPGAAHRCLARLLELADPGHGMADPTRHEMTDPTRHSRPPNQSRHSRESGNPAPAMDPRFRGDDGNDGYDGNDGHDGNGGDGRNGGDGGNDGNGGNDADGFTRPLTGSTILDAGCGAGRTSFDLAARRPDALVLGIDLNLALLRLARQALAGTISYPRRRIGLVYDRRRFPVAPTGAARVDFWACDALALPFAPGVADLTAALNLLDCVAEPARLLAELAATIRRGGHLLLATPYDWSTRATPMETWIGGHSQRADHAGAAEPFLRTLLTEGAHPRSVAGLRLIGEDPDWPWQTRLHERSSVQYRSHLLALERT